MADAIRFPSGAAFSHKPSAAQLDWLFRCLDGHPNDRKKALIQLAASPAVGFIDADTAASLIRDLGLGSF